MWRNTEITHELLTYQNVKRNPVVQIELKGRTDGSIVQLQEALVAFHFTLYHLRKTYGKI